MGIPFQPIYIPPKTTKAPGYFYPVPTVKFELPRQSVVYLPPTTPAVCINSTLFKYL